MSRLDRIRMAFSGRVNVRMKRGDRSAVPTGLLDFLHPTQDFILGYFQSSLRDWFRFHADSLFRPGLVGVPHVRHSVHGR